LVADPTLDPVTRGKLELVLEVRAFAELRLGLPAKGAFTQYADIGRDTLVLVLSAAERDRLVPLTWWFPVVGRVPYKGFFRWGEAIRTESGLREAGLDTYLRPAPAFSTLGWFADPLLNTTLQGDSASIVATVIHELTHVRYFAKDAVPFNESFANFVGARGAEQFFRARGDVVNADRVAARWADERRLAAFWRRWYGTIDSTFASLPGAEWRERRLALRDSLYAAVRRELVDAVAPLFQAIDPRYAERVRLDNAALIARRIYLTDLETFEGAYAQAGGDLDRAMAAIIRRHLAGRR
jgi:predicted aminopeptidase